MGQRLNKFVTRVAYAEPGEIREFHPLQISLLPFLSFASSVYSLALTFRRRLYDLGFLRGQRLPVPVISVGNLTWGGNGKTPMVEYIALLLHKSGISPLVLTRGYAGGDEARMLQEHFAGTSVKVGVGANRAAVAASFFTEYGYGFVEDKIGVAILDDGMQHWSLSRNLEIVMVNGMAPWGNKFLLPRGPLREPFTAFRRADVVVIHHADMVSVEQLRDIRSTILEIKGTLPIFFSKLSLSCFFKVKKSGLRLPLRTVHDSVVLCVSAIGCANSFVEAVRKIGPAFVDRFDFSDHYFINQKDVGKIKERLANLRDRFGVKPIVVTTEKDFYRDPSVLEEFDAFEVLVLCCSLQIMPFDGLTEDSFKKLLQDSMRNVSSASFLE